MKRRISFRLLLLLLAIPFVLEAQMTYVPDDNFEQALIDLGLDTSPLNDSVATSNIDTVMNLNVSNKNIVDLTGIEDFIVLRQLDCSYNQITALNMNNNIGLTQLYANSNKLTSLIVDSNKYLSSLYFINNLIENIDLSKLVNLQSLFCDSNRLVNLDVSKNTLLNGFYCSNNQLTSLDVSKNYNFIAMNCCFNQIKELDLTSCHAIDALYCTNNKLEKLIVNSYLLWKLLATNNPDLRCIQVKRLPKSGGQYFDDYQKDPEAYWSLNCNYTGIDDKDNDVVSPFIFPNPASDYIDISIGNVILSEAKNPFIKIYNILGECCLVAQTPSSVQRVDVSHLAPGVYFVRVGDVVKKFVKL